MGIFEADRKLVQQRQIRQEGRRARVGQEIPRAFKGARIAKTDSPVVSLLDL